MILKGRRGLNGDGGNRRRRNCVNRACIYKSKKKIILHVSIEQQLSFSFLFLFVFSKLSQGEQCIRRYLIGHSAILSAAFPTKNTVNSWWRKQLVNIEAQEVKWAQKGKNIIICLFEIFSFKSCGSQNLVLFLEIEVFIKTCSWKCSDELYWGYIQ